MDKELREALDRLEAKQDKLADSVNAHLVENARNVAELTASTKSAHKRLDEYDKTKQGTMKLWFGLLLAFGAELFHWFFGGKKP